MLSVADAVLATALPHDDVFFYHLREANCSFQNVMRAIISQITNPRLQIFVVFMIGLNSPRPVKHPDVRD